MLQVQDLHVRYGNVEAVRGIEFSVGEGELITLIGANGAGKSTLLRTISGLIRPSAGSILFEGARIDQLPPYAILQHGIVHVPERRSLFPAMTVLENLELGAYRVKDKTRYAVNLEQVFAHFPILKERSNQLAGKMSGGEQQMCAIARGLMFGPRVLLLDEPSLGLSPLLVGTLGKIIQTLHQGGLTIVLVEQNAYMALSLADRGYVLENGRVLLKGPSSQLLADDQVREAYLGM